MRKKENLESMSDLQLEQRRKANYAEIDRLAEENKKIFDIEIKRDEQNSEIAHLMLDPIEEEEVKKKNTWFSWMFGGK